MAVTIDMRGTDVGALLRTFPGKLALEVREEFKNLGIDFQKAVGSHFAANTSKGRRAKYWVLSRVAGDRKLHQYRKGPGDPGMEEGDALLGVFSVDRRLHMHEFGGVVRDPSGGSMAIPMGDAATKVMKRAKKMYRGTDGLFDPKLIAAARPRKQGRIRRGENKERSQIKIVVLNGKAYIAQVGPTGEYIEKMFAHLVRSVTMKPKLGFYEEWRKAEPKRQRAIDRALARSITWFRKQDLSKAGTLKKAYRRGGDLENLK